MTTFNLQHRRQLRAALPGVGLAALVTLTGSKALFFAIAIPLFWLSVRADARQAIFRFLREEPGFILVIAMMTGLALAANVNRNNQRYFRLKEYNLAVSKF
ncbi:MAG: hypothetical protein WAM39_11250 [Bryobacteraceae bacterium]